METKGKVARKSNKNNSKKERASELLNIKEKKTTKKNRFSKRKWVLFVLLFLLIILLLLIGCPWVRRQVGKIFEPGTEEVHDSKKNEKKKNDKKENNNQKKNEENKEKQGNDNQNTGTGTNTNVSGQTGSNGNQGAGDNNSGTTVPTPAPVLPIAHFRLVGWEQSSVTIAQASQSTTVIFRGQLYGKAPIPSEGIHTGYYIQFMAISPIAYSSDTLNHMHITTATNEYDKQIDGYVDGKPFFYITQEFKNGMVTPITINWGDGIQVTYTLSFQVETI